MDGVFQTKSRPGRRSSSRRILFLLAAGILVFLLSRGQELTTDRLRQLATDIVYPVTYVVTRPIEWIQQGFTIARDYFSLRSDNLRYQVELERLRDVERENQLLKQKLENYQMLLGGQGEAKTDSVAANVMFDPGGPFVRTYVIDTGRNSGITVGDPVIGMSGLVGRIVSVGALSSRVLLLTDLNSRIPVRVEPSGFNAILAGTNTSRPKLLFYSEEVSFADGDRVLASGLGGQIPRNTMIGRVRTGPAGNPRVELSEKPENLNIVRVMKLRGELDVSSMQNIPEILKPEPEDGKPDREVENGL